MQDLEQVVGLLAEIRDLLAAQGSATPSPVADPDQPTTVTGD